MIPINYIKNKKQKFNYPNRPLISIITVVYNRPKYLEKTILSVINQKYRNFEYIVVDGGSTDNTSDVIFKYKKHIDKILIQKDKGVYDAFNKGIKLCTGEFIGIINSDDIYTKEALNIVHKYYSKNRNIDFIFGAVKKHYALLYGYKPWKIKFSWGFYTSHSTGFFIKRSSMNKIGYYNLKYKFSSDYDLFYRMIVKHKLKGVGTKKNELFGIFRRGGMSSKVNAFDHFVETTKIRVDNKQNKLSIFMVILIRIIYNFNTLTKSFLKKNFSY